MKNPGSTGFFCLDRVIISLLHTSIRLRYSERLIPVVFLSIAEYADVLCMTRYTIGSKI